MASFASPSLSRVHFPGLNVLRFFAALAIVVYHSTFALQERWPGAIKMTLHNLTTGVDLFFIISGFLIIYLLILEKETTRTIDLKKFYLRRALRIFPLYFLVVGIAYYQYHATNPEIDFSKYLYFWGNFWMIGRDSWTVPPLNPLWSLCIEEQFYFVIPLLVLLVPTKRIPYLFAGVILLSLAFRAYTSYTVQYNWMLTYCHTLSRCDLLAVGGLIAYWHYTRPIRLRLPDWLLLLGVFFFFVLIGIVDSSNVETMNLATVKKYLFALPLVFIFCFLVFNDSPVAAALNQNKVIDYLGKISFGLYMYHSIIIDYLTKHDLLVTYHPLYVQPLVNVALTIVVASLSYELFEKQILRLKKRFEVIKTQKSLTPAEPVLEQQPA